MKNSEIKENSFIMIEFENGKKEPYFVDRKGPGSVSGATMLLGHTLSDLIKNPTLFPCSKNGGTDRYYIANEKVTGKDSRVKDYHNLSKEEKRDCLNKLKPVTQLAPLLKILSAN